VKNWLASWGCMDLRPFHSQRSVLASGNRHIIGSQNDLIYLLRAHLEDAAPPLEGGRLRKVEDSLNQAASPSLFVAENALQIGDLPKQIRLFALRFDGFGLGVGQVSARFLGFLSFRCCVF
jgi:hypothetical protein